MKFQVSVHLLKFVDITFELAIKSNNPGCINPKVEFDSFK